jgi:hypothetical protein
LRDELPLELGDAAVHGLALGELVVQMLAGRDRRGGVALDAVVELAHLLLVALDLALEDLGLRAQCDKLDPLAVGCDRVLVEVGGGLGKLFLGGGKLGLGLRQETQAGIDVVVLGLEGVFKLFLPSLERKHGGGLFPKLELEAPDRLALLSDVGELARGLGLHLLDAHFEASRRHRKFGSQLILVGLDLGHGHRRDGLEPFHREPHGTLVDKRDETDDEEARHKKSDPAIHDRFDHGNHAS